MQDGVSRFTLTIAAALMLGGPPLVAAAVEGNVQAHGKKTIGLTLNTWRLALFETPDLRECPQGLHQINKENWQKDYPTQEAQDEFTRQRVFLGPRQIAGQIPALYMGNRGPSGEHVAYAPTLVKDLPLREVRTSSGYGIDLDDRASPEDFTSPAGEAGIDNQLARVWGCSQGWRTGGGAIGIQENEFRQNPLNRWLIEISDVDDEANDDYVEVGIYKGRDPIIDDALLKPIVGQSQRVDMRLPRFNVKTTGRIVNGVLSTAPVDRHYPVQDFNKASQRFMRGLRLRLELNEKGAAGYVGGYENLKELWWSYGASIAGQQDAVVLWSPPAIYEALGRLADGYPDATGRNTAISAAYQVQAVRSLIIKPAAESPLGTRPGALTTARSEVRD